MPLTNSNRHEIKHSKLNAIIIVFPLSIADHVTYHISAKKYDDARLIIAQNGSK